MESLSCFSLMDQLIFPSASCKMITEENLYIVPSCELASSRQIAMFNIWDSSHLLCYLIDGHISFPDVCGVGVGSLWSYKESKIVPMLSAFCYSQVCEDVRERMLLGLVNLNTQHTEPSPALLCMNDLGYLLRKGVQPGKHIFFPGKRGSNLEIERSWLN